MDTAFPAHASPLCHRATRHDSSFRNGNGNGSASANGNTSNNSNSSSAVYSSSAAAMSLAPQTHINAAYNAAYLPLASSRAPLTDSLHGADGHAPATSSEPVPTSCHHNGKKYQLVVVQQPQRARMCGFGDKDRRPITPPPCVKLIVTDLDTGKESDFNAIEHGMFVLNVDLWSADGKSEVNLVRQTANSPSISSTISVPYQDNTSAAAAYHLPPTVKSDAGPAAYAHYAANESGSVNSFSPQHPQHLQAYNGQSSFHAPYAQQGAFSQPPTPQQMYFPAAAMHAAASPPSPYADAGPAQLSPYAGRAFLPPDAHRLPVSTPPQGMFTRNLIGSLAASAFRLTDPEDKIGIWFVLQDLSVRTEGDFRLRFSFVNVSEISPPSPAHLNANSSAPLNKSKSPVLARCFSDVFSVYSAKRFPGVVESTPLSRCFATQGIKIPIRKDAAKGEKEKDEDED